MYVYEIVNNITGKRYYGQTHDIEKRIYRHKSDLINNRHCNIYLQQDFNRYGMDIFSFNILYESLTESEANIIEEELINCNYDSNYNISKHSHGGDNISYHPLNESIREKISITHKQRYIDNPELIENLRIKMSGENNPMYGKTHTAEAREKISKAVSGKRYTDQEKEEFRARSYRMYEQHPEIKQKISKSLKNAYKNNDELRKVISEASKNNWKKPEVREKIINGLIEANRCRMKPVYGDGVIYESISDACRKLNVKEGTILNRCKSPNFPNWGYAMIINKDKTIK